MAYTTLQFFTTNGGNKHDSWDKVGICQQLASNGVKVVLTARDVKRGNEAVDKLKTAGYSDVVFHQLDVTDPVSISFLLDFIKTQFGKLDILFIGPNAKPLKELIKQTYQTTENCLRTNYYGTKQVSKELIPLLQLSNSARIVNVSSGLGQLKFISNENARKKLEDVDGLTEEKVDEVVKGFLEDVKENSIEVKGWPINFSAYVVSKAALNAYTRVLAQKNPNIAINSVGPGYTKTDLNDNTGVFTIVEAAKGPVMLALMPEGGPSGLFFDQTEVSTF
ncbi:salutaridine reductase-like [Castanea sativa]|uniref:salutaridine reductase-like n=1 Tax=Castanea sativa TaxID=21020 RepID=UPI003F64DAEE